MKSKKADVWISGVMYFALGVIVLTIILTASMPVINRLRDKNTVLQTKDLMFKLDDNIRTNLASGPGSQRTATIQVGRGDFSINDVASSTNPNTIIWTAPVSVLLSEEGKKIKEGGLFIVSSKKGSGFETTITLDYTGIANIVFPQGKKISKLSGNYNLAIQNIGPNPGCSGTCLPRIQISEI